MKMRRFFIAPMKGMVVVASVVGLFSCASKQQANNQTIGEFAVIAMQPSQSNLKNSYVASIRGKQDVEIRSKVNGFITELCVDEGSVVRKGQTLFIIDPVQYQAAVKVAQAAVEVAKANVATSKLTVDNKRQLAQKNIISAYDLQMAENQLASMQAVLAQANAQLVNARNDLSYTKVTSPSNGVVGTIPYRVGSLVSASTQTPLTMVSDISQMYVYFSVNEKQLLDMTRQGGTIKEILAKMPEAELQLADGTLYDKKGKIETLSGVIDQTTGTVTMRATFPNPNNVLRSGGSGIVLLPYVNNEAIIIPQKATYEIQDKKFVYLLTDSSTVAATQVSISPLDNGSEYIVTEGLNVGDRIVVEGISSLRNGMKIVPITPEQSAAKVEAIKQSK